MHEHSARRSAQRTAGVELKFPYLSRVDLGPFSLKGWTCPSITSSFDVFFLMFSRVSDHSYPIHQSIRFMPTQFLV